MIKENEQFRVETIEELKEAYKVLPFRFFLKYEIKDFEAVGMRYISLDSDEFVLHHHRKNLKVVPNPFKQAKPELTGIDKAMEDLSNEAKKLGFSVEVIFKNLEK